ncbi:hypothetical protein ESA94_07570 [Lacibacter luteus]|uniref:Uncharacterized protein n=1 Tax=Lacibacter luteus TaxID=2508719 RepID=A0A4Q1CJ67_9BACT|nr:hypothetical protein [Lacibacter luteus]RXK60332.1 hypothetical protein ESA94_07570 [Lacibacter luteus]
MRKIIGVLLFILAAGYSEAQELDSLRLVASEIPEGYRETSRKEHKTVHAASFYEQIELYESFLGKLKKKSAQSFTKKGDNGTILYFEFEKEFEGAAFLEGLLWGQEGKAAAKKSDEYFSKGRFLVIWSFGLTSEIKQVSKTKIISLLK